MSYDIWGNPLKSGYCEVHPDVHSPYPCECCLEESYDSERYRQAEAEAARDYERQFELYLSVQYYLAKCVEWLRCNRTGEPLPAWWYA